MTYYFLYNEFLQQYRSTKNIETSVINYINENHDILNAIYLSPKRINNNDVNNIIKNKEYKDTLLSTISNLDNINLQDFFKNTVNELGSILNYKDINKKVYVIIGLNTTTIYSTKYNNEDITVILLESTLGIEENIKMLLAHEYTHWIREKEIRHNIFEDCIGERFITEGIACNFSEEIVPNKPKSYYCIVPDTTTKWVQNNMAVIGNLVKNELDEKDLIYDFFYMFAKTKLPNMPVRTGYVYGYLKVKEYMKKNNLKIEDIIKIEWQEILNRNNLI